MMRMVWMSVRRGIVVLDQSGGLGQTPPTITPECLRSDAFARGFLLLGATADDFWGNALISLVGAALVATAIWVALLRPWLRRQAEGDAFSGFCKVFSGAYHRVVHRARFEGFDSLPDWVLQPGRPLIITANHQSGIDPVLVQATTTRHIRWMMDAVQMLGWLGWFWRMQRVLPVKYAPGDSSTLREALRHLKAGGTIGLFAEGGIARPPCRIYPFKPGSGALAVRTGTPVLLLFIDGTPKDCPSSYGSFFVPSRAVVRALGVFTAGPGETGEQFSERLRATLSKASGWPTTSDPLLLPG